MLHGTAVVWLPVSDVPRSLSFYRDTLSLDEVHSGEDWAELDANGLHIGLNSTEKPGADGGAVIAFQPQTSLDEAVEDRRRNQRALLGARRDVQRPRRQRSPALRAALRITG